MWGGEPYAKHQANIKNRKRTKKHRKTNGKKNDCFNTMNNIPLHILRYIDDLTPIEITVQHFRSINNSWASNMDSFINCEHAFNISATEISFHGVDYGVSEIQYWTCLNKFSGCMLYIYNILTENFCMAFFSHLVAFERYNVELSHTFIETDSLIWMYLPNWIILDWEISHISVNLFNTLLFFLGKIQRLLKLRGEHVWAKNFRLQLKWMNFSFSLLAELKTSRKMFSNIIQSARNSSSRNTEDNNWDS